MAMTKSTTYIMLIDPFPVRRERLRAALMEAGHRVLTKSEPGEALIVALAQLPRLIVADIDLEEPSVLQRLRKHNEIPLILLASSADDHDVVAGFERGADDVIAQPHNQEVFLARVSAVLNRTQKARKGTRANTESQEPIVLGELVVDPASHSASVANEPVELSQREFSLLYALAREAGSVVPRDELLKEVWGPNFSGETQTIYVYINWLRKKLRTFTSESPRIVTVHGVGYKLIASRLDKSAS